MAPLSPPVAGRKNRKLRAHLALVWRARLDGYSITGIHEFLAFHGVYVGRSAVAKEVTRMEEMGMLDFGPDGSEPIFDLAALLRPKRKMALASTVPPVPKAPMVPASIQKSVPVVAKPPEPASTHLNHSRADVDAFFAAHIDNPLLRAKLAKLKKNEP